MAFKKSAHSRGIPPQEALILKHYPVPVCNRAGKSTRFSLICQGINGNAMQKMNVFLIAITWLEGMHARNIVLK
jgi:hypothetical protein